MTSPDDLARAAAERLAVRTGYSRHDVAIVLGSGWAPAAGRLGRPDAEIALSELPGFAAPAVAGHAGTIHSVEVRRRRVLVFLGRTHLYEGLGTDAVVHPVRTAAAAGCAVVVLTNAAGAVRPDLGIGQLVLIADHLNLTARSPLAGPNFVDLTDLYAARLRALARTVEPRLVEGVYAALPGPHYETPAEIRMLRTLGADLVGMSTALEAIAARAAGCEVLALSLVTNLAAGVSQAGLDHSEVLAAGQAAAPSIADLLAKLIDQL